MRYISTRGGIAPVDFRQAVIMGMANDGGLLLPETIPCVVDRLSHWKDLAYPELECEIFGLYADLPKTDLREIVTKSCRPFRHPEVAPISRVNDIHVMELFHGPTLAFKDVALQFLGNLFEYILRGSKCRINVLAATSGDTGSAAICGLKGKKQVTITVLHPHGRISPVQERQMTSVIDKNVFNIAIEGSFDDCQGIVKAIFGDIEFKRRFSLGSVNSINWARLLAQIVYYFYGAFRVMEATGASKVRFAVPTGNFGNILAGYIAAQMGLPVGRFVLATNENDILARFFNSGVYRPGDVRETISPSMDIQVAGNFERYLYYRLGQDHDRLKRAMDSFAHDGSLKTDPKAGERVDDLFAADSRDTEATQATIRKYYRDYDCLFDPHTAVGVSVAEEHLCRGEPMICLATAHPAKFGEAIRAATGRDLARHPIINGLQNLSTRYDVLPTSVEAVRRYVEERCPAEAV